ncbi:MAG: hypothetical protein ACJ788_15340 [Ktedonobacteraceae bacterium]
MRNVNGKFDTGYGSFFCESGGMVEAREEVAEASSATINHGSALRWS